MTATLQQERAHLGKADKHIAEGECTVTEQEVRIERLRADGQDTSAHENVLATFRDVLAQHRAHRALILGRIAHLEGNQRVSA